MFLITMLMKITVLFKNYSKRKINLFLRNVLDMMNFWRLKNRKAIHNFLKHYDQGKNIYSEDKPTQIERYLGLTIYSIEFQKHKDSYNFSNPEELVDGFLKNVRYRFKPSGKKWIKCSFTIENIQQSPYQDLRPIINSRYWTTQLFEGVYFNDFIFFGLRRNILSRVVVWYSLVIVI